MNVRAFLVAVGVVLLTWPADLLACPNCKTAIAENGGGLATGYAWSIVILLAVPAALIGAWLVAFWRLVGQQAAASATDQTGDDTGLTPHRQSALTVPHHSGE